MPERPNGVVLKTTVGKLTEGSNPSPSSKMIFHNRKFLILFVLLLIIGIFFLVEKPKEEIVVEYQSGFNNDQIEKSIINYLLTEDSFKLETVKDSFNFCSVENLDSSKEVFPLDIWVYCGEFVLENDKLKTVSEISIPIKLDYPNELSFYNLNRFSYNLLEEVKDFNSENIIEKTKEIALNNIIAWKEVESAISKCEIKKVVQNHNREVILTFNDGRELNLIEPKIDKIIEIIKVSLCEGVQIMTE